MKEIILHESRAILEISGVDRKKFLQGLITNDIHKAGETNLVFAVMLNAQGRFLYDFFIFEHGEKLMLDCLALRRDEILKKLNFYKLRSQVVIAKNDELLAAQTLEDHPLQGHHKFRDPRGASLGYRLYIKKTEEQNFKFCDASFYHFARIQNKIPESEFDLTYEKSFILEFGFDELNAIDYQKGCYVGQETTARTHYRGQVRKKLFHIKLNCDASRAGKLKDLEITCEGKDVGVILSSVFHEGEIHALALLRLPDEGELAAEKLQFEGEKIFIVS